MRLMTSLLIEWDHGKLSIIRAFQYISSSSGANATISPGLNHSLHILHLCVLELLTPSAQKPLFIHPIGRISFHLKIGEGNGERQREMRVKEIRRDGAKPLKWKVGEVRGEARRGWERRTQGSGWKGEWYKCHGTDGIPCLSSRVGKKNNTQLSVKWPQLTVGCCHGYCPRRAAAMRLSLSNKCTGGCLQLVWLQGREGEITPVSDPHTEAPRGISHTVIIEPSYWLMMLHHCLSLYVCLVCSVPLSTFLNSLRGTLRKPISTKGRACVCVSCPSGVRFLSPVLWLTAVRGDVSEAWHWTVPVTPREEEAWFDSNIDNLSRSEISTVKPGDDLAPLETEMWRFQVTIDLEGVSNLLFRPIILICVHFCQSALHIDPTKVMCLGI